MPTEQPVPGPYIQDGRAEFLARKESLEAACRASGLEVRCICFLRANATQADLYAQGRSKPGRIVTNAKPGHSPHNYSLAADYVVMIKGKPCWDVRRKEWRKFVQLVRYCYLTTGYDFAKLRDWGHVELLDWKDYVKWE